MSPNKALLREALSPRSGRGGLSALLIAVLLGGAFVLPLEAGEALVTLDNGRVRLAVFPAAGGRAVVFAEQGGPNLLFARESLWSEEQVPLPAPDVAFEEFGGHIFWLSPQQAWWNQQTTWPERRGGWPPDPWLEYGRYEVVDQGPLHLTLQGPPTPVGGVALTLHYTLAPERPRATLRGTARNTSGRELRWGLWSNTRLAGWVSASAAHDDHYTYRLEHGAFPRDRASLVTYRFRDGWMHLDGRAPEPPEARRTGKYYLTPPADAVFAVGFPRPGQAFVLSGDIVQAESIYPGQAPIEIAFIHEAEEASSYTELEMQGAYVTLQPGESLSLQVFWELVDCPPDVLENDTVRRDFLETLRRKVQPVATPEGVQ